jgi:hypothetical protein
MFAAAPAGGNRLLFRDMPEPGCPSNGSLFYRHCYAAVMDAPARVPGS